MANLKLLFLLAYILYKIIYSSIEVIICNIETLQPKPRKFLSDFPPIYFKEGLFCDSVHDIWENMGHFSFNLRYF